MSDGHLLPNSAFSDVPIRQHAAPADPAAARDFADILGPIDDDAGGGEDAAIDPPYPFNTFSLFNQTRSAQADARDLLGL
jgi:hypothetical protein